MQLVRSSAKVGDTNAEALYYLAIASARESLELTAAYFVPRPAFTQALCDAAERGVDVRVLVPGPYIDKGFVRIGGRRSYERQLLDAGVRIFEYQPTMLHAKSLCVDGAWSAVGTVNFDNRSFQLHDEVTLGVWDDGFAAQLSEAFGRDLERSDEIEPARWAQPRRRASGPVRRRPPCSVASSDPPILAIRARAATDAGSRPHAASTSVLARRRRHPVLAALGDADQAVLRLLRTRGHREPVEVAMQRARDGRGVRPRSGPGSAPSARRSTTAAAASGCSPGSSARSRSGSTSPPSSPSAASGR